MRTLVLLAAGQGTRLRPLTNFLPKCLVPVKDQPMLDGLLEHFEGWAQQTVIVSGHAYSALEEYIQDKKLKVHTRYNPLFEVTNSLFSVAISRDIWAYSEEVIVTNTDVVFKTGALNSLLHISKDITLSVDVKTPDDEDMKIMATSSNHVARVSKNLPNDQCLGEFTGVAKLKDQGVRYFLDTIEVMLKRPTMATKGWYDLAFDELAQCGTLLNIEPLPTLSYAEIDTLEDLKEAQYL